MMVTWKQGGQDKEDEVKRARMGKEDEDNTRQGRGEDKDDKARTKMR